MDSYPYTVEYDAAKPNHDLRQAQHVRALMLVVVVDARPDGDWGVLLQDYGTWGQGCTHCGCHGSHLWSRLHGDCLSGLNWDRTTKLYLVLYAPEIAGPVLLDSTGFFQNNASTGVKLGRYMYL